MSYTKTTWVNESEPAINATNLNHIEQGIYDATETADAAAPQSTTYTKTEVDTALGGKVDKVSGKGLSTNDYDDTEKGLVASALQASALTPYRTATAEDVINATKADKTALDKTDRSLDMLWKLNKGQTWDFDVDTDTLYTKTVPSGAKYDSVDMVGGKSVVMNQLIENKTTTLKGVTATVEDGVCNISGTATDNGLIYFADNINVPNHKILFWTNQVVAENITFILRDMTNRISYENASTTNCVIITIPSTCTNFAWYCNFANGNAYDIEFKIDAFDLTKMFGAGNEPTTVEQFKAMFPNDYYPYNTGEIKSASVDSIIVKDDDEVTTSTFNVPSAIQSLTGYGWGVGTADNRVSYAEEKYRKCMTRLKLNTANWSLNTYEEIRFFTIALAQSKSGSSGNDFNAIMAGYINKKIGYVTSLTEDKTYILGANTNTLYVRDDSYSDATSFKNHFGENDYIYFELATPIETDISALIPDGFMENFDVESGGTITYHNSLGDGYKLPVPATNEFIVKIDEVS